MIIYIYIYIYKQKHTYTLSPQTLKKKSSGRRVQVCFADVCSCVFCCVELNKPENPSACVCIHILVSLIVFTRMSHMPWRLAQKRHIFTWNACFCYMCDSGCECEWMWVFVCFLNNCSFCWEDYMFSMYQTCQYILNRAFTNKRATTYQSVPLHTVKVCHYMASIWIYTKACPYVLKRAFTY
jgi:hypothetical protein